MTPGQTSVYQKNSITEIYFMKSEIILIGPIGSGKSTISELISIKTGLPRRSMDELRWKYYDEIGYDRDLAWQGYIKEG